MQTYRRTLPLALVLALLAGCGNDEGEEVRGGAASLDALVAELEAMGEFDEGPLPDYAKYVLPDDRPLMAFDRALRLKNLAGEEAVWDVLNVHGVAAFDPDLVNVTPTDAEAGRDVMSKRFREHMGEDVDYLALIRDLDEALRERIDQDETLRLRFVVQVLERREHDALIGVGDERLRAVERHGRWWLTLLTP